MEGDVSPSPLALVLNRTCHHKKFNVLFPTQAFVVMLV